MLSSARGERCMNPAIFPIRLRISMAYVLVGTRAVLVDSGCPGE